MTVTTANGRSSRPPKIHSSRPPKADSSRPANARSSSRPEEDSGSAADAPSQAAPKQKRKRLRKEEILAEATRLFAERGYEGASMGDLAARVGLRKASLFHHFPSKDVLYATVLTELMESVKRATINAAMAEGSFGDRLDALTDALTATLSAQPHAARLLVREAMDAGPVMREGLGRTINDVLSAALEFAKQGKRAGTFDPDVDPVHVIVSIIGIHFMPFAIADIVDRFTGSSPFHASFVEERRIAVRMQVRNLVLAKSR